MRFPARAGGHVRGEPVLLVQSRGRREGGAAVWAGGVARRKAWVEVLVGRVRGGLPLHSGQGQRPVTLMVCTC